MRNRGRCLWGKTGIACGISLSKCGLATVLGLLSPLLTVRAGNFAVHTHVVSSGGGRSSSAQYAISGTVGEPGAATPTSGAHAIIVAGGFWQMDFRFALPPAVVGRFVFYNQSIWDGNDAAANVADDGAIADDKVALLPGGVATFANYTSFSRGLNGILVDIRSLPGDVTAADFGFKIGNDQNPAFWPDAPAPTAVTIRRGAGLEGSDRVTLIWDARVIQKQWLQVTLLATANTGLVAPDVFYFGNAVAETGNRTDNAAVTSADALRVLNNISASASILNPYDINRDGKVGSADRLLVLNNLSALNSLVLLDLRLPTVLSGGRAIPAGRSVSTRITWEPGALCLGVESAAASGIVELWAADTLEEANWKPLDLTPVHNPQTGHLEFRIPTGSTQPQRFYRVEIRPDR